MTTTTIKMESVDPISLDRRKFEFAIELPQRRVSEKRPRGMMSYSIVHQLLQDEPEQELSIVQKLLLLNDNEEEEEIPILNDETELNEFKEEVLPVLTPTFSPIQEEEEKEKVEPEKPIISKKSRTKSDRTKKQKTQISREV